VHSLVVAGWTGRNLPALEAHIKELEALGVKRPKSVPIFYRNAAALLTIGAAIEAVGDRSSGEVEFVLFALDDGMWVGVAQVIQIPRPGRSMSPSQQMCEAGGRSCGVTMRSSRIGKSDASFIRVRRGKRLYQEGQ
jgi:hypothetical protein